MSTALAPWRRLTLQLESRLDAVALPGQVVYLLCIAAGFSPLAGSEVEVCVAEALNNCIHHAYQGYTGALLELDVVLEANLLIVDVWDSGISADANHMNADHRHALDIPPDGAEDIPERGRGLAMMQQVMDSIEYTPGTMRNRLRMTKRRDVVTPSAIRGYIS